MSSTDLTPDLAGKVLQAEQRNLVKKVGAGQTLSAPQRQMIMGLAAANASPEELRTTRANALLKKWLDGGRLGRDEREEIAQMFPDAVFIINGADDDKPAPLTEKEVMERYELSRATFFRWKNHGASLPTGPDAPPWEDAVALVAWYERMRARGLFKHRCPRALLNAARLSGVPHAPAGGQPPSAGQQTPPAASEQKPPPQSVPRQSPEKRGFLAELESLQEETAMLREEFQKAEKDGKTDESKRLKAEYFETLETLRKYEKDKEQIAVANGELVRKSDVEKDLAERLPSIVSSLEILIDRVEGQLITTSDRVARRTIWRNGLAECFKALRGSRFAPPFALSA